MAQPCGKIKHNPGLAFYQSSSQNLSSEVKSTVLQVTPIGKKVTMEADESYSFVKYMTNQDEDNDKDDDADMNGADNEGGGDN